MRSVDVTFAWPDGARLRVQAQAPNPERDVVVRYEGAIAKWPDAPAVTDLSVLEFLIRGMAERVQAAGGSVQDNSAGDYDAWAL